MSSIKLKFLTLEKKIEFINDESNLTTVEKAKKYGIGKTQVSLQDELNVCVW